MLAILTQIFHELMCAKMILHLIRAIEDCAFFADG